MGGVMDTYIVHVVTTKTGNFRTLSIYIKINYKFQNKHSENGNNLPWKMPWDIVCAPVRDTIRESIQKKVHENENQFSQKTKNETV